MRRFWQMSAMVTLALALFGCARLPGLDGVHKQGGLQPQAATGNEFQFVMGRARALIGFARRPGAGEEEIVRQAGGEVRYTYRLVPGIAALLPEAAIAALRRNPNVTYVEADGRVQALTSELDNSWGVVRIGADVAHTAGNTGANVSVAVIDTGIDYRHPDVAASYQGGYDFVNRDADPMDDHGHGTHVAGIVAARRDGTGVVGVARRRACTP